MKITLDRRNNNIIKLYSIIVPVYNSQNSLDECLQSIISIKNYNEECELIIVNDASIDSSIEIANKYNAKIISNLINKGAAYCRNLGAKAAKGKYLIFIDSDIVLTATDILLYLKEDFDFLEVCGIAGIYDKKVIYKNFLSVWKHLYMCYLQRIVPKYISMTYSAILAVPKESYLGVGGFNEKYGGVMAEDIEFSIKLALKEKKRFFIDDRIQGLHIKKYNIINILKTDYMRIKGIISVIQDRNYRKVYLKSTSTISMLSLLLIIMAIMFLFLSLIRPILLVGLFFSIILFLVTQMKLLIYLKDAESTSFALSSMLFYLIEMSFAFILSLYFGTMYKLRMR